jgi:hypothetical protein
MVSKTLHTKKVNIDLVKERKNDEKASAIMVHKALHKKLENDEHEPYYRKESGELCCPVRVSSFKKGRHFSAANVT